MLKVKVREVQFVQHHVLGGGKADAVKKASIRGLGFEVHHGFVERDMLRRFDVFILEIAVDGIAHRFGKAKEDAFGSVAGNWIGAFLASR